MTRKRKRASRGIVISLLLLALIVIFCPASFAGDVAVGRVTHLSGPLFAKKADGTTRVLSVNSVVEKGDILVTEKKTYARVKFTDSGEMNLRPRTQIRIDEYVFDQDKPKEDKVVFNMVKGGIRSVTGMIGKRGNQDGYKLVTETAVAGVRGTAYECKICQGNCGSIPDGLYFFVLQGVISVSNNAGSQNVSAGQYAYVPSITVAPQILQQNPGIDFTLPKSIADVPDKGGNKETEGGCIVR